MRLRIHSAITGMIVFLLPLAFLFVHSSSNAQGPSENHLDTPSLSAQLRQTVNKHNLSSPVPPDFNDNEALQKLGSKLFFDQLLSGTRDTACATCHHHNFAFSDGVSLTIGSGAKGFGTQKMITHKRQLGVRNSTSLSHRFLPGLKTMLWDMRVERDNGTINKPLDLEVPDGIDTIQEVQFLDALRVDQEMKGLKGKKDIFGDTNEFARVPDSNPLKLYKLIVQRLMNYQRYRKAFRRAYPETPLNQIEIQHVTNALLHFLRSATTFLDSPWDKFLKGKTNALRPEAMKGALLFYGKANCSNCHSGNLLTDQQAHNIGIPQIRPGFKKKGFDPGRYRVTGDPDDRFAFRTPPLRDVELSRPWMHNGAYKTLREAVRHHMNPENALRTYRSEQLAQDIQFPMKTPMNRRELRSFPQGEIGQFLITAVQNSPSTQQFILQTLSPDLRSVPNLTPEELDGIMAFLQSLTSPTLRMIERKGDALSKKKLLRKLHTRQFPGHASAAGIHLTTHDEVLDELEIPSVNVRDN